MHFLESCEHCWDKVSAQTPSSTLSAFGYLSIYVSQQVWKRTPQGKLLGDVGQILNDGSFDITPLLLHYQSQLPQIGRTPLRYWTNEIQSPHSNFATTKKSSIANDKEIFHPPSQRYATKKQTKCQVLWNTLQEYLCILFLFVFAKLTSKPGLGRCTFAVYSVIWKQIKLGLKLHTQIDKSPFNVTLV